MSDKQAINLAAPEFPDALNGRLRKALIQNTGGRVRIPVSSFMAAGDKVTLYLNEYPEDPVQTFPEVKEVAPGEPLYFSITTVGHYVNWETLEAHYTLTNKDGKDKGESASESVEIV